jgi:type I restriction enzyme R subunit
LASTVAQVIAVMVAMAKEVCADGRRGEHVNPDLTADEFAFDDVVAQNESAVSEMGVGVLGDIAGDLVRSLRRDATTVWVSREDAVRELLSTT